MAFVAMPFIPVGCINVLFCAVARPECVVNVRVTISVKVRHSNPENFAFWIYSFILFDIIHNNLIFRISSL